MSLSLSTDHWQYLLGTPTGEARFKADPEDFQVIENLGYEPCGEGEHVFLYIEKVNNNTAFVAEALAKFAQVPLRQVTYAGRKDKFAKTQQWIGVHLPGKEEPDWSQFSLEGVTILSHTRHNKKLRTGQLKGNRFIITLRDVTDAKELEQRLTAIAAHGVPNYYGSQRFGQQRLNDEGEVQKGGNLALAERMVQGEAIRNRNKRSMALSALRSWLFNEFVSARIEAHGLDTLLAGDALNLSGSNSFFVEDTISPELNTRYQTQDIAPTAPLWGKGNNATTAICGAWELACAKQYPEVCDFLAQAGLKMERRAIRIWPESLEWHHNSDTVTLSFSLPAGCFATSVLRECVVLREY